MGCGCGCKGAGGCGPRASLGDTASIGTIAGAPKGVDPIVYLRAQLNRFTAAGGAPYAFQYATAPLQLTPVMDATVAQRALFVLSMRAGYAATMAADPATSSLLATYAQAWTNPTGYVTANLALVTDVVRLFADSQRIPAATGIPRYVTLPLVGDVRQEVVVGAAALAALLYLTRKGRR